MIYSPLLPLVPYNISSTQLCPVRGREFLYVEFNQLIQDYIVILVNHLYIFMICVSHSGF